MQLFEDRVLTGQGGFEVFLENLSSDIIKKWDLGAYEWVLTPDDAAGEIGFWGGFAGREESINLTRLIRFFEGMVILFVELILMSDVLDN